jgi:hypothetical protein
MFTSACSSARSDIDHLLGGGKWLGRGKAGCQQAEATAASKQVNANPARHGIVSITSINNIANTCDIENL